MKLNIKIIITTWIAVLLTDMSALPLLCAAEMVVTTQPGDETAPIEKSLPLGKEPVNENKDTGTALFLKYGIKLPTCLTKEPPVDIQCAFYSDNKQYAAVYSPIDNPTSEVPSQPKTGKIKLMTANGKILGIIDNSLIPTKVFIPDNGSMAAVITTDAQTGLSTLNFYSAAGVLLNTCLNLQITDSSLSSEGNISITTLDGNITFDRNGNKIL